MNVNGRPRVDSIKLKVRLHPSLITLIAAAHPELFRHDAPGVFKHGSLSRYISSLIRRDAARRGLSHEQKADLPAPP